MNEKSAQIVYEQNLRPKEVQYKPWIERITGQLLAAYSGLENEAPLHSKIFSASLSQASITTAIAWQFTQSMLAEIVPASSYPALVKLSTSLEKLPEFKKYPTVGPGVKQSS